MRQTLARHCRINTRSTFCFVTFLLLTAAENPNEHSTITQSPHEITEQYVLINGTLRTVCSDGYLDEHENCIHYEVPQCPAGHVYVNALCYPLGELPQDICPDGYFLSNNLCYRIDPLPCPANTTETPTETTGYSTTTTERPTELPRTTERGTEQLPTEQPAPEDVSTPAPEALTRCPPGSVFMNEQCRKILCWQGEYYEGRCLQPACPEGTVWRGQRCQPPNFITTIIEIDNVFVNEAHDQPGVVQPLNENNVQYYTPAPPTVGAIIEQTTSVPPTATTTQFSPTTELASTTTQSLNEEDCCSVVTPRICKHYGQKWVCFNRRYKRCDPKVCTHPLIYLKAPQVIYEPPILIMPPNPPFAACVTANCDAANAVDCSGCPHNRRETCSPYCYRYMCPDGACHFMDLHEYCYYYPGEFGCTRKDGCIWDWCGEKC